MDHARWTVAVVVVVGTVGLALAACKDARPQTAADRALKGARRADPATLAQSVKVAAVAADAPTAAVAAVVAEACGAPCACLVDRTCPDLGAAPPDGVVASEWNALALAGAYLAREHAAAAADGKQALATALAPIALPLQPTAGLGGVTLPASAHATALAGPTRFVAIDAGGKVRAGALPVARLTPRGAVLDRAPGGDAVQAFGALGELTAYLAPAQAAAAPPPTTQVDAGPVAQPDAGPPDAHPERTAAIEAARSIPVPPGVGRLEEPDIYEIVGGLPSDEALASADLGSRARPRWSVAAMAARVSADQPLVLVDRASPVRGVVEALAALPRGGVLAVEHGGAVAAFPLAFGQRFEQGWDTLDARTYESRLVADVGTDAVVVRHPDGRELARVAVTGGQVADGLAAAIALGRQAAPRSRGLTVAVRDHAVAGVVVAVLEAAVGAEVEQIVIEEYTEPSTRPMLRFGQASLVGALDKRTLREHVRAHGASVLACYTDRLRDQPELEGAVLAQLVISPRGAVVQAVASGVDPAVAACVARVLKTIAFPGTGDRVMVNQPFTFTPYGG